MFFVNFLFALTSNNPMEIRDIYFFPHFEEYDGNDFFLQIEKKPTLSEVRYSK